MMDEQSSFQQIIDDLGMGDEEAARQIVQRFTRRLLALAQTRLDARLQQKVAPEDVLQSVYRSFFRRHQNEEFNLDSWDGLWALLATITVRKCCQQVRHYHRERRDLNRETPSQTPEENKLNEWQMISNEPTPEQAALLTELLEEIMSSLDPQGQTIFMMRLQGFSEREICEEIARSERTVRRTLNRIRSQLSNAME
ncbi:RNA polymerase sigma factor [Gimesia alba]|uniref:RNA polymerase sigma factor n=1 Tax=Gimesia alba TaxID=2527973 RepID=A0A517RM32_9PLAN|nr:sigma-70 family RNA polymerase sigma factor [Gimesia alba]QDT44943.1 RNA polymerase sigma factor [Gimesia alba]